MLNQIMMALALEVPVNKIISIEAINRWKNYITSSLKLKGSSYFKAQTRLVLKKTDPACKNLRAMHKKIETT
jgi:hypothetical protein